MTTSTIEQRIKKLIVDHLEVPEDQISNQSFFVQDLGADSLDAMDLLMLVNDEFHIQISPDKMEHIHTVQDMIDAVSHALEK